MILVPVPTFAHRVLSLLSACTLATAVVAQCTNPVIPQSAHVGTDGIVHASTWWDPDGAGPATPVVVFGGEFTVAGTVTARNVATYDPATSAWGALPGFGPLDSGVLALCTLPNGDLVAGGQTFWIAGVPVAGVVRWTGSSWASLGGGMNGRVNALVVDNGGGLVAGGAFQTAGGVPAAGIARFAGGVWSSLGAGVVGGVSALLLAGNGDILAAMGGAVARWNGSTWTTAAPGFNGLIHAIAEDPSGLIVGGIFATAAGVPATQSLARWDGVAWSSLGIPPSVAAQILTVHCVLRANNGDLVVGVTAGALPQPTLRFDGTTWSSGPAGAATVHAWDARTLLELPGGDVLAGGLFGGTPTAPAQNLMRVSPTVGCLPVQGGLPVEARCVLEHSSGDLFVGGTMQSGYATVWRRQAADWSPVGVGPTRPTGTIEALVELPNGDVVAAGFGPNPSSSQGTLTRWNGTAWSSLGTINGTVRALLLEQNGDLVVGGAFSGLSAVFTGSLARWNGTSWAPVAGWTNGAVTNLARLPSGEIVASTSNRVYRGVGATWLPLGSNIVDVRDLAVLADGTLVAGGGFTDAGGTPANRVARWNGTSWLPFGSGIDSELVEALLPLPNGDLLVGGSFSAASGAPALGLARWNGSAWAQFGPGAAQVADLTMAANGDVLVAGAFTTVGAEASRSVVRFTTTCPATAFASGAGCVGSAGANVLATTSLPWLGSTFRSVASGLAPSSIAVHVLGAGPASVPLPTLLPQASAGCVLQVTPDALAALPTNAGVATVALPIPNVAGLLGLVLHQQVVALELDAFANVTGASAGNVLVLTLGAF